MSTINMPPTVNDQGNINAHIEEGVIIPIEMQDEQGEEIDVSAADLVFYSGDFEKTLGPDSNNPEGRVLILTPTDLLDITHGDSFRLMDETGPTPIIRWEGKIYKRGG